MNRYVLVLAICCTPQPASAAVVTLGFNSLPSAQGWTYIAEGLSHGGQLESNIWSTDGTTLSMNTMGSGLVPSSGNTYSQTGIVNTVNPFELTWRMRIVDSEGWVAGGWGVSVAMGAQQFTVGFITNAIWIADRQMPFDATAFHDYRLTGTPRINTFSLYVDNVLFANGRSIQPFFAGNYVLFGDLTGAANAQAQLQAFTFRQVPEPATMLLAVYGTALCAIFARARRRPRLFGTRTRD
jgi:PEP-CTERM motif